MRSILTVWKSRFDEQSNYVRQDNAHHKVLVIRVLQRDMLIDEERNLQKEVRCVMDPCSVALITWMDG